MPVSTVSTVLLDLPIASGSHAIRVVAIGPNVTSSPVIV